MYIILLSIQFYTWIIKQGGERERVTVREKKKKIGLYIWLHISVHKTV